MNHPCASSRLETSHQPPRFEYKPGVTRREDLGLYLWEVKASLPDLRSGFNQVKEDLGVSNTTAHKAMKAVEDMPEVRTLKEQMEEAKEARRQKLIRKASANVARPETVTPAGRTNGTLKRGKGKTKGRRKAAPPPPLPYEVIAHLNRLSYRLGCARCDFVRKVEHELAADGEKYPVITAKNITRRWTDQADRLQRRRPKTMEEIPGWEQEVLGLLEQLEGDVEVVYTED